MALLDEGCDAREVVRDMPCWRGMGGRYLSTNSRRLGAVGMGGQGSACHEGGSSSTRGLISSAEQQNIGNCSCRLDDCTTSRSECLLLTP